MAPSVLQDGSGDGIGVMGNNSVEKKLRKRRELDAVVAKANRQRHSAKINSSQELLVDFQNENGGKDDDDTVGDGGGGGDLRLDIESPSRVLDRVYEEESSDFDDDSDKKQKLKRRRHALPRRLNKRSGMSSRHKSSSSSSSSLCCQMCGGLWLVTTLVGMCFMVVFAVLGLHVQMKVQVDTFRAELDQGGYQYLLKWNLWFDFDLNFRF